MIPIDESSLRSAINFAHDAMTQHMRQLESTVTDFNRCQRSNQAKDGFAQVDFEPAGKFLNTKEWEIELSMIDQLIRCSMPLGKDSHVLF